MSAQAYFKDIQKHIAEELNKSKDSIWLALVWFTDPHLFNIVSEKAKIGLKVRLILLDDEINKSNKSLDFDKLEINGGEIVWVKNEQNGLMHNIFCVIDSRCCINGSYNWTIQAASSNHENITIHNDQELAKDFEDEFKRLHKQFNKTIAIGSINKRLTVLKTSLQDGDQDDVDRQYCKLKDLLKYNIENTYNAKKEILLISNKIGKIDNPVLISEIDKFISSDWYKIEDNFSNQLIPYRKEDKWGFCDKVKRIVIPCKYDRLKFYEGFYSVMLNGKCGFIDKAGNEFVECIYDDIFTFNEGLCQVVRNKKFGFINETGKEIVPCKYEKADNFKEGFAAVQFFGKWGYTDKEGNEIISCKYNSADSFSEGLATVEQHGRWGYIDKTGEEIIPCKYQSADDFSEGLAVVEKYDHFGIVDKTGNEVVPFKYNDIEYFNEGLAKVERNNKYGFIDLTGKEIIPCKFDWAFRFIEGFAMIMIDKRLGVIDKTGKSIISGTFDDINSFDGGLAEIKIKNKWGFIDKTGKIIIDCKYDETNSIIDGLIQVNLKEKWGNNSGLFF